VPPLSFQGQIGSGPVVADQYRVDPMTVHIEPEVRAADSGRSGGWRRLVARFARPFMAIELAGFEILVISLLFSFEVNVPYWQHPAYWIRHLQMLVIVAAVAWAIMMWPRRSEISELWVSTSSASPLASGMRGRGWGLPLAVNLVPASVPSVRVWCGNAL